MKCNNCSFNNKSDDYFCVKCGNQLRTKHNGWKYLFLISLPILLLFLFMYTYSLDRISILESRLVNVDYLKNKTNELSRELSNKEYENRQLKLEQPKIYETRQNNVTIYSRYDGSNFEEAGWQFESKGTQLHIYVIDNGYGLTQYGWVSMSSLKEVIQ
ncbi:MAG: hypothetical protein IKA83_01785 [Paludibacteraceae bacterium]|nr:hypothetical protein [Paludibacteraceae bacterium]